MVTKIQLGYYLNSGLSTRVIALELRMTIPQIHAMMGCPSGLDCDGKGCRVRQKEGRHAGIQRR